VSLTYDIDGGNITPYVLTGQWKPLWNMTGSAVVRGIGSALALRDGSSRMNVYLNGGLVHSGPCWYSQAEGNPTSTYAEITSYDDTIYTKTRVCKTATGNLITPGSVITDEVTAPAIIAAYIDNVNSFDPSPMPLTVGSVAGGGDDVSGVPMNFPMDLAQMIALMVSTGQLDVIVSPGTGGSTVALTNGDGGSDLSGSVSYEYATGAHNAGVAQYTVDMQELVNALWYYLGPRISETRWKGSITSTAPHVGGTWPASLLARIAASRALYNYHQYIRVFDDNDDENSIRPLFEAEWANETWLRTVPRNFASVKPRRGLGPSFSVGDKIHVAAGSVLSGGFSGDQRVYGMVVSCDHDGVLEVTDILTSADQEGLP
jgi:hypothetical protein